VVRYGVASKFATVKNEEKVNAVSTI